MNEKINLCELLKDCPINTEFYSPLIGNCKLSSISDVISVTKSGKFFHIESDGFMFFDGIKSAELMLYPSCEQRDWNVWRMGNMNHKSSLMDKPTDEMVRRYRYNGPWSLDECCQEIKYGRDMVDEKYHGGVSTWSFPEGVKDKIENDKKYHVWYHCRTSSDPSDTSIHYTVYYIEECES